mmetsp:Transcript_18347/g.38232  ORF Transcript_18347/g.38232 Transcript_18347/m.38232 type:complete len:86 (-) Transcript_18347:15-272(-)
MRTQTRSHIFGRTTVSSGGDRTKNIAARIWQYAVLCVVLGRRDVSEYNDEHRTTTTTANQRTQDDGEVDEYPRMAPLEKFFEERK